ARMRMELALAEADSYAPATLMRIRKHLGADLVVLGSYLSLPEGDALRVDLRLQDAVRGETLTTLTESGNRTEIDAMAARAGAGLRHHLGLPDPPKANGAAGQSSTLPRNPEAARGYSE